MPVDCTAARTWLSADLDGETLHDPAARAHIDACDACRAWESTLSTATRRLTLRPATAPDVTARGLAAWATRNATGDRAQARVARALLAVAGGAGLVLAALTAAGLVGPAGHSVTDLVAMECALAVGFLVGAWRPDRYTRGLLPVAAVAAVLTLMSSAGPISAGGVGLLREAAHLPVLLGVLGLFVLLDATGATIPRHRR